MDITIRNLSVSMGQKEILKNVSFSLKKQNLILLLGLNGSGKTTLMRTLLGVNQPRSGDILLGQKKLLHMHERERSKYIAYVPQLIQNEVHYTVEEYVVLGTSPSLGYFSVPGKREYDKVKQVLEKFGLLEKRKQTIMSLSGGERQLVALARARIQDTPWMILDEPLANLDYVRQHEFMNRLQEEQKVDQQGIFMSVHDPNIALTYADTVIVLHHYTIQGVLHREENDYEEKLMKVLNHLYDNHMGLVKEDGKALYYWKE